MDLKFQAVNYGSQLPALLEDLSTAHKLAEHCPVESKYALFLDAVVIGERPDVLEAMYDDILDDVIVSDYAVFDQQEDQAELAQKVSSPPPREQPASSSEWRDCASTLDRAHLLPALDDDKLAV